MLSILTEPKAMLTIAELIFFILVIIQICIKPEIKKQKTILRSVTGAYSAYIGFYSVWYIVKYLGEKSALRGILSLFFALVMIINNIILENEKLKRSYKVLFTLLLSVISFIALVVLEYKIVS